MAKQKEQLLEDEVLHDDEILEDDDVELVDEDDEVEASEEESLDEMDTKDNGTEAAATLKPKTKSSDMMKTLVNAMSGMSGGDMVKFFDLAMAAYKEFPQKIPDGAASKNEASIRAKGKPTPGKAAYSEELEQIFGGDAEELSEELKEKMTTLFEAAVETRVLIECADIQEEFDTKLKEEIEELSLELTENVNSYLEYVAVNWLKENEVAVEHSLKSELTESFINDLGELCKTYRLELPDGEDDVIEKLVTKVDELEEDINQSEAKNIELCEELKGIKKENLIERMANELSPMEYTKFKTLAENIEYEGDEEKFEKKLDYIKEGFFADKPAPTPSTQIINEQIAEDAEDADEKEFSSRQVEAVYHAISRTAKT